MRMEGVRGSSWELGGGVSTWALGAQLGPVCMGETGT